VPMAVVGNKVGDGDDVEFLRQQVGEALIGWISASAYVRAGERGEHRPLTALEPDNLATLDTMGRLVDATEKDWDRFQRQAVRLHLRNARAWANDRCGFDLAGQVDPEFTHGPDALAGSGRLPATTG